MSKNHKSCVDNEYDIFGRDRSRNVGALSNVGGSSSPADETLEETEVFLIHVPVAVPIPVLTVAGIGDCRT